MERKDFGSCIQEVQNYYGKEYNEIQLKEIYRYFQGVTTERFKYVISKIYENCSRLPMLSDFAAISKDIPFGLNKEEIDKPVYDCKVCGGKGFVLYKKYNEKFDTTYEYTAHCICKSSRFYRFDGTKIKDDKAKSLYYYPSIQEVILDPKVTVEFDVNLLREEN